MRCDVLLPIDKSVIDDGSDDLGVDGDLVSFTQQLVQRFDCGVGLESPFGTARIEIFFQAAIEFNFDGHGFVVLLRSDLPPDFCTNWVLLMTMSWLRALHMS